MNDILPMKSKHEFAVVGNPVINKLIDDDKSILLNINDSNDQSYGVYAEEDLLAAGTLIGKMMTEITSHLMELNITQDYEVSENLTNLNKISIEIQKEANTIISNVNYKYNTEDGYYVQLRPYVFCNYNEEKDKYTFGVNDKNTESEYGGFINGNIDEIKNMIYDYNRSPLRPKDCTSYIVISYEFIKKEDLLKAVNDLINTLQD